MRQIIFNSKTGKEVSFSAIYNFEVGPAFTQFSFPTKDLDKIKNLADVIPDFTLTKNDAFVATATFQNNIDIQTKTITEEELKSKRISDLAKFFKLVFGAEVSMEKMNHRAIVGTNERGRIFRSINVRNERFAILDNETGETIELVTESQFSNDITIGFEEKYPNGEYKIEVHRLFCKMKFGSQNALSIAKRENDTTEYLCNLGESIFIQMVEGESKNEVFEKFVSVFDGILRTRFAITNYKIELLILEE